MDESSEVVINVTLPWPPSINSYWRRNGNNVYISPAGKKFRDLVIYHCRDIRGFFSPENRLKVSIQASAPDKRKRDIDNILKSLLDALQHAEVFADDNQIDYISIERMPPSKGCVDIVISLS